MEREQAKILIKETFENPFDKDRFINFIVNLLNLKQEDLNNTAKGPWQGVFIPVAFQDYISKYERIAKYNVGNNRIDILVVYLKKETSIERARRIQRNFVLGYLKGNYGSTAEKDATLVAFVSPQSDDWRFSLVKMDYRFEETPSGKVKNKREFTPAKRWSFLVGKNEKSHTVQSQLIPILEDDEKKLTLEELEQAFNIEIVTKEFFEKYRDLFIRTKLELDKIVQNDIKVKQEFESKNINTVDFAKKFLGQITFLYFIQKKGWFGVEKDNPWGTGSKDFIRKLFNEEFSNYENFYNEILEPLFYEALRTDRTEADHYYSRFNCKLPFLNGGLFDPINNYDWVTTDILIPNELFSNTNNTKEGDIGDGILDVFDRYNFTVNEEEPLEKEVALDPELLGKIYEKLNAIRQDNFDEYLNVIKSGKKGEETKFNKEYGVYYTPREIVHYMCQEGLMSYLETELQGKVSRQELEKFFEYAEILQEYEAVAHEKEEKIESGEQRGTKYKSQIPDNIKENAKEIDTLLDNIKICDPAVGSGAFPIGMMHEIIKLRQLLSIYTGTQIKTYDLKRHTIENSLYGVDIDPGAVETCKLRFYLSLIVDEDDFYNIKPLPNFDYKIVCGNSLLGVEKDLFNHKAFAQLEELKPKHFNETNPTKKQEYKKQIDKLICQITNGNTEFDFEVYFSEVFHQKGGFDIVIGNPPYVRQERIKRQKPLLQKAGYEVYNSTSDIYTYFYEKSYQIAKPNGFICLISSNKWMRAKYGEKLRKFFKNKTEVINLIDFGGYPVFEATVDTNIILLKKKQPDEKHKIRFVNVKNELVDEDLISFIGVNKQTILQEKLNDNTWTLADEGILELKEKIEKKGIPLKNWDVRIYRGVITGFNEAFIIDSQTKEKLCKEDPKSIEILKPILRGRDIGKYYYRWAGLWLIRIESGWTNQNREKEKPEEFFKNKYPAIYNYLIPFKDFKGKGKGLINRDDQGNYWWELRDCDYYPEFEKEKIVWAEIVREPSFAYDTNGFYCEATSFFMIGEKLKYLISILNSKPATFFFKQFYAGGGLGEKGYRYKKAFIEQLPIPVIPKEEQQPFIDLVDKILAISKDDDYLENPEKQSKVKQLEKQIDQLVYKLYGLTDEEITIVEKEK